ncbi:MAG: helix-hairpin-helix domain-containing protein, partial [Candidatus Thermoplasmatota archaeon]
AHEIRLDEEEWIDVGMETTYTFEGLDEGYHTLEVRAEGEQRSVTDEVGFTVDLDAEVPTLGVTSPGEDGIFSDRNVTVEWESENAEYHEIRLNEEEWIDVGMETTHTFEELEDGEHSVEVRAVGEHESLSTDSVNFIVDTLPPEIEIVSPEEGMVLAENSVTVEWDYDQAISGMDRFEIRLDGGEWNEVGVFTEYEFSDLSEGEHTVEIRAVDNAGNEGEETVSFEVSTEEEPWLETSESSCLLPLILTILIAVLLIVAWYGWREREDREEEEREESSVAAGKTTVGGRKEMSKKRPEGVKKIAEEPGELPEEPPEPEEVSEESQEPEEPEEEETKECPLCGGEVPADAEKCPLCGEPLGSEETFEGTMEGEEVLEDLTETDEDSEASSEKEKYPPPPPSASEGMEEEADKDKASVVKEFTTIRGVGPSIARNLYDSGYHSIEQLKEAGTEDIKNIEGIGATQAGLIHESVQGFKKEEQEVREDLSEEGALKEFLDKKIQKIESLISSAKEKGIDVSEEETLLVEGTSLYEEERLEEAEEKLSNCHTRIEERLSSESEKKAERISREEALEELRRLKGLGATKAETLYENGIRSLKDLEEVSKEDLQDIKGIGPALSEKILESVEEIEE